MGGPARTEAALPDALRGCATIWGKSLSLMLTGKRFRLHAPIRAVDETRVGRAAVTVPV
jgi:hypothetical protein